MSGKQIRAIALVVSVAATGSLNAAEILFGHVGQTYYAEGTEMSGYLISAGHSVTTVDLWSTSLGDLSVYDQIWVYDLNPAPDNNTVQNSNYAAIASWFNGLDDQNLIADGRIISSAWNDEDIWIQNYAVQLDLRGGGLVLGTDHQAFVDGINTINAAIGIDLFHGTLGTTDAVVDESSPLFVAAGTYSCANGIAQCVFDQSSPGYAPAGLQPNGMTLTPIAYHGTVNTAWENAAISSTIGSITFGTCGGPNQEPCETPVPSPLALIGLGLMVAGFARSRQLG